MNKLYLEYKSKDGRLDTLIKACVKEMEGEISSVGGGIIDWESKDIVVRFNCEENCEKFERKIKETFPAVQIHKV